MRNAVNIAHLRGIRNVLRSIENAINSAEHIDCCDEDYVQVRPIEELIDCQKMALDALEKKYRDEAYEAGLEIMKHYGIGVER